MPYSGAGAQKLTCRQGVRFPPFTEAAAAPRASQIACAARRSTAHLQLASASATRRAPSGSDLLFVLKYPARAAQ